MKLMPKNIIQCFYAFVLFIVVFLVGLGGGFTTVPQAYADTSEFSNVLDDLRKDESFSLDQYPVDVDDYSIQVIQVAESENNELFIYTYQPCQLSYPLVATEINMSLSNNVGGIVVDNEVVAGSDNSKLYTLTLLNTSGVFAKYKVNDFVVSNDLVRYYTISSIYRNYINGVDGASGNDNTILSKSFSVGKQYAAITTENGVSYGCKDIDFVVIENPFVDFLAYGTYDGFDLIFGNVDYTDIHYIAFSPDRQIDTLKEADVTYTTQSYTINDDGYGTGYKYGEKSEPQFKTLTGQEEVGVDGYPEYTWKSILKSITAAMQRHYTAVCNTFGCGVLSLAVESGKMNGEQIERRWYKMPKKVYANRYSTDCLAGIFERRAEQNNVGLDDLPEYAGSRATWEELQAQHSHFQNDMERVNEGADERTDEPQTPVPAAVLPVDEPCDLGYNPAEILGIRSDKK